MSNTFFQGGEKLVTGLVVTVTYVLAHATGTGL